MRNFSPSVSYTCNVFVKFKDQTHDCRSFTSWTFQPGNTPLAQVLEAEAAPYQRYLPPTPTPMTYLLTQAVGRIYMDNLDNVQSSWVLQGLKVGQLALNFGANDLGSIMMEMLFKRWYNVSSYNRRFYSVD